MIHFIAIALIFFLVVLIVDPYIALWQMMHSASEKTSDLEWSINDLTTKLGKITEWSVGLQQAQNYLKIAKQDLAIAKQDLANKKNHAAMIAAEDGLTYALKVRKFLDSNTNSDDNSLIYKQRM